MLAQPTSLFFLELDLRGHSRRVPRCPSNITHSNLGDHPPSGWNSDANVHEVDPKSASHSKRGPFKGGTLTSPRAIYFGTLPQTRPYPHCHAIGLPPHWGWCQGGLSGAAVLYGSLMDRRVWVAGPSPPAHLPSGACDRGPAAGTRARRAAPSLGAERSHGGQRRRAARPRRTKRSGAERKTERRGGRGTF